jgi:hypothetical protein
MTLNFKNSLKAFFSVVLVIYFFVYASDPVKSIFLNNLFLAFHESGHLIFSFLGDSIGVWGGTIMQLLIPFFIIVYFFFQGSFYSSAISGMFLGASFINISFYIKDAISMNLDLLGGGIHDWNYILSTTGFLGETSLIGSVVFWVGLITIVTSFLLTLTFSFLGGDNHSGERVSDVFSE